MLKGIFYRLWILGALCALVLGGVQNGRAGSVPLAPSAVNTFVVTNTNDSGAGSLRQAILDANATANLDAPDEIHFNITVGSAPFRINVPSTTSPLPSITQPVVIDGTTQPGYASTPVVVLQGNYGREGLTLEAGSSGSTIKGLAIGHFSRGIYILSSNNTIQRNYVGVDYDGTTDLGNAVEGIWVKDSTGNLIGGPGVGNVISANLRQGIWILGGSGNTIQGNTIGTTANGSARLGNGSDVGLYSGVEICSSSTTLIGGSASGAGNLISGNYAQAILLRGDGVGSSYCTESFSDITIQGNRIGLNGSGTAGIGNGAGGIGIWGYVSNVLIGGDTTAAGNVISGNGFEHVYDKTYAAGVYVHSLASNIRLYNNIIGLGSDGNTAVGNAHYGIASTAPTIAVGKAGGGNVVSGNGEDGIYLTTEGGTASVQGNIVGLNAAGDTVRGNTSNGLTVIGYYMELTLGGSASGEGNVFSGNGTNGAYIRQSKILAIQGNIFGLDKDAAAALGNGAAGLEIRDVSHTSGAVIGGAASGAGNWFGGNAGNGLVLIGDLFFTIQGNFFGTNASDADLHNDGDGIYVGEPGNITYEVLIGGEAAGEGNTIAYNGGSGIGISKTDPGSNPYDIGILRNSIYENGSLGIDLGKDGVTSNKSENPVIWTVNNSQNFPVLSLASSSGTETVVMGTLKSRTEANYRIEFFGNVSCDGSGNGEGATFLGAYTGITDASGRLSFNLTLPNWPVGQVLAATATYTHTSFGVPAYETSEFSACKDVTTITTWDGDTNTDWADPANWTSGVPNATLSARILSGTTYQPTLGAAGGDTYMLLVDGGAVLTQQGPLQVHHTLVLEGQVDSSAPVTMTEGVSIKASGVLNLSGSGEVISQNTWDNAGTVNVADTQTVTVKGNWYNPGTFMPGSGQVILLDGPVTTWPDATGYLSGDLNFYNLKIDRPASEGDMNVDDPLNVSGQLWVEAGSVRGSMVLPNDVFISNGLLDVSDPMTITGDIEVAGGYYEDNGNATIFAGSQPQTILLAGYIELDGMIIRSGADATLLSDLYLAGNFDNQGAFHTNDYWVNLYPGVDVSLAGNANFDNLLVKTGSQVDASTATLDVTQTLDMNSGAFVLPANAQLHDVNLGFAANLEMSGKLNVSGNWINYGGLLVDNGWETAFNGGQQQVATLGTLTTTLTSTGLVTGTTDCITATTTVTNVGRVKSVKVTLDSVTVTDLEWSVIEIESPSGKDATLLDTFSATGTHLAGTVFVDGGAAISSGTEPYTGEWAANDALAEELGNVNSAGDWTLWICDWSSDIKQLDGWQLTLEIADPSVPLPASFSKVTVANTGSLGKVTLGSPLIIGQDMAVQAGAAFDFSTYTTTVEGTFNNSGIVYQTQDVTDGLTAEFFHITNAAGDEAKYHGVDITPSGSMGATQVVLAGNAARCTTNTANPLLNRCYSITPQTQQSATVRYWFTEAERNGQEADKLKLWHWGDITHWTLVGTDSDYTYSESGAACVSGSGTACWFQVAGVSTYSPFAVTDSSLVSPLAVRQLAFQARASSTPWLPLAAAVLAVTAVLFVARRAKRA